MLRSRRVAVLAAAALSTVGVLSVLGGAHPASGQADPGSRALLYLQSQQSSDGSIPSSPGSYTPSELYAIGGAAAGYDPKALSHGGSSVIDYLAANVNGACRPATDPSGSAGACGELIQAVVAARQDPTSFAGAKLVERLNGYHNLRTANGAYGDGQAFTQALALQGLVAAAAPVPSDAVSFLERAQNSKGGWDYLDVKDDPNAAANFDSSDTNSTAMALMALDAAGDHSGDSLALRWLHTQQQPDGGFPYQQGSPADPDSTALVIQAILGAGQNPQASNWSKSGHAPLQELIATQASSGGYAFPGNKSPDAFTTSQVPPALELQAFPVTGTYALGFTPAAEGHATRGALVYLQSQQSSDGSIPSSPGSYGPSELFAIGGAAAGYDPNALSHGGASVMDFLVANVNSACRPAKDPNGSAGACGELIQAVVAAGRNPTAFAGQDLVGLLSGYYNRTTRNGAYGDGQAFTQALAIQGLVAAGAPVPPGALTYLESAQNIDGGWDYLDLRGDPSKSDTNSTSVVLMALDAAGDHSRDTSALAWLGSRQQSDGGFPYQGSPSDPDSTALVIQAVIGAGQNPQGPFWSKAGHTPLQELIASQGSDGGYTFPGSKGSDAFTTSQVPLALERVALPVPFGQHTFYQPGTTIGGSGPVAPAMAPPPGQPVNAGVATTPRPSALARGAPSTATPQPTVAAATASPAPSPSLPGPSGGVAGATTDPTPAPAPVAPAPVALAPTLPGRLPAPLVYLLAGLAGAVLVGGGGALLVRRR